MFRLRANFARPLVRSYMKHNANPQIYLHPVSDTKTKVSFSPKETAVAIGTWSHTSPLTPESPIPVEKFTTNPQFTPLIDKLFATHIYDDFTFQFEAGGNPGCYMPIYDFRAPPVHGRIPEVDDIFGYVLVNHQGQIVEGSWQENFMYRVVNSEGIMRLSDHMLEVVRKECELVE
ncbi:hypothetical protein BABINDRAFT_60949 [Babjeviella inositovora NRRL Y-12698]|uniref:Uncharacterized protein n=1 Tax=Babjeviella inositovora NRRL Y-12698 TaxID=984486 RepID=A0A1E3QTF3_9ASCO|nr:uncharacterized protein BABINDRAFT_60949 [Babjeviella inositovora NRRL Y-12698]ODQ80814.1 hypothetical protein BABINDRAFT_60949 [Babjeviella inositovora NRRL Y-12698]